MLRCKQKIVAWGLILSLLNLVFAIAPGGMAMAAKGTVQSAPGLSQTMADIGCHELSSLETPMVMNEECPDCENGCSLCYQVPLGIPLQAFTAVSSQQLFVGASPPHLIQFNPDPLLPPPREQIVSF